MSGPRKVVSRVSFDGLKESEGHPDHCCSEVKIPCKITPEQRTCNGTCTENHDFNRVSVFCSETKGCRPFVMDLVDVFVEWTVVQSSMGPIMEKVFKDKE